MKITLIILGIIIACFFIFVAHINGIIRGLKIMSTRSVKTSDLEKKLIRQFFKDDKDVDAFFYSKYMKDEMAKNNAILKQKAAEIRKEEIKPTKKAKKNVRAKKSK